MKSVNPQQSGDDLHRDWIPLLELSTREVFELMINSHLSVLEKPMEPEGPNITSMVGLAGRLCGVLSVRCQEKAAALMASKMLGVELDKVGPEIADALGEVCNMVAGNFKNKISGMGDGCMLSPPSVIMGNDYSVHSTADTPSLEVGLMFENMPLLVSLQIHS